MAVAFLGIGSNRGDRAANIQRALALLQEGQDIRLLCVSRLVETKPEGGPPQGDFLNGVLKIETDLLPLELLSCLKGIERRLGRVPSEPNSPRPLDLDILTYDDVVIVEGKSLSIPHPRMAERLFVLEPFSEIAPELVHPRLKKTIRELYDETRQKCKAP